MTPIMHWKDRHSGVQFLHPKKARTLISLDTAVCVSVCLGHIPGIPGQLRTVLLPLCLYSEKKNKCCRASLRHQKPSDSESRVAYNIHQEWKFQVYERKLHWCICFLICLTFTTLVFAFNFIKLGITYMHPINSFVLSGVPRTLTVGLGMVLWAGS